MVVYQFPHPHTYNAKEIERKIAMAMAMGSSSSELDAEPSFAIRGSETTSTFMRSISTKESSDTNCTYFSDFSPRYSYSRSHSQPPTPPRLSLSAPPPPTQQPLPPPPSHQPNHHPPDHHQLQATSYRCISSVLKKDGQILSIASSNGLVYTGSENNVIRVWKLPEFTECDVLKTKACMVVSIRVSNDKVYAAYADCKIRVWLRTWDGAIKHVRVATIPKTGWSYLSSKDKMMKHLGPISSLEINVADDILYSASLDKTVKVWRISDHKCIETIQAHPEPINAIVVADDGVLYTASDDSTVRVWRRNFCSGDRPHSLTVTLPAKFSPVKTLVLTGDGAILYGGCSDGYIHYWHKGWFSGQLQYGGTLQGHTHAVLCLASVGNYVVSGSADSTTRVWVRDQEGQHSCVSILQGHRGPIRSVAAFAGRGAVEEAASEDGCTICTGSLDGVLKVWHITGTNTSRNILT